ncbi:two-component system, response regulator, stage 0 sporulation protein F [Carboxydocella thermautotrophica]|nr:two-component system, response regulator, stage 0 sporulation protein F [Carboxydocella thermautotrophica]
MRLGGLNLAEKKILIVDVQVGIRMLMREALKDLTSQLEMAASGQEAIEKFLSFQPDIMLIDLKMPGMNGLEVLEALQDKREKCRIILMTAYGELDVMSQVPKIGIDEYLTKPFDINELRQIITRYL